MDQLGDKPEEVRKKLEDQKRQAQRKQDGKSASSEQATSAEPSERERTGADDRNEP